MSVFNPLPMYFEIDKSKFVRYEDNICLCINPVWSKYPYRIRLFVFRYIFETFLSKEEQAKWLKWHLSECTYKKWS